jgi:acetolactate synthase-1/2/3 large subunit
VSFPNILRVAGAYDIPHARVEPDNCDFETAKALASSGPFLCEVMLDPLQKFEPRLAARKLADGRLTSPPLEDMFPFLEREEFSENLLIPAWSAD